MYTGGGDLVCKCTSECMLWVQLPRWWPEVINEKGPTTLTLKYSALEVLSAAILWFGEPIGEINLFSKSLIKLLVNSMSLL